MTTNGNDPNAFFNYFLIGYGGRDIVTPDGKLHLDATTTLLSFLLCHGRIYSGRKHWTKVHLHWLAQQKFDQPAQQIVFQDAVDAGEDAATRLRRLDQQVAEIVPSWSMAPVVEAYQAMRGVSFGVAAHRRD